MHPVMMKARETTDLATRWSTLPRVEGASVQENNRVREMLNAHSAPRRGLKLGQLKAVKNIETLMTWQHADKRMSDDATARVADS
jgi:hypothetical protein